MHSTSNGRTKDTHVYTQKIVAFWLYFTSWRYNKKIYSFLGFVCAAHSNIILLISFLCMMFYFYAFIFFFFILYFHRFSFIHSFAHFLLPFLSLRRFTSHWAFALLHRLVCLSFPFFMAKCSTYCIHTHTHTHSLFVEIVINENGLLNESLYRHILS